MRDSESPWWREKRLLIVDDDERFRDQLARVLGRKGLEVACAKDVQDAKDAFVAGSFDLAVVDLKMGEDSGFELLRWLSEHDEDVSSIVLTGYGSIATTVDAIRLGALNYLQKPADADDILAAFERGFSEPLSESEIAYEAPSLARAEWEHIQRVLADCGGNISETARRLGIHRRTLQRKLATDPPQD